MLRIAFQGKCLVVLFLGLVTVSAYAQNLKTRPADLTALPKPPEGWVYLEEPNIAVGNQLFTVINGGAELYVRLGFTRAVFASYRSVEGKSINLEVYEMKTPAAARKTYDRKTGTSGRAVDVGAAARLEEYYLNFYKGPYQITVSGYAADTQTAENLLTIARLIDERLNIR